MAITIAGQTLVTPATLSQTTVTLPTGTVDGSLALVYDSRIGADASDPTIPAAWSRVWGTQHAFFSTNYSALVYRNKPLGFTTGTSGTDTPGDSVTFTDATSIPRGVLAVTLTGGRPVDRNAFWHTGLAAGATGNLAHVSSNRATVIGDEIWMFLTANADANLQVNGASTPTATWTRQITNVGSGLAQFVFRGVITTGAAFNNWVIPMQNNGAGSTVISGVASIIRPAPTPAASTPKRVAVFGDSLTHGGLMNSGQLGKTSERWIDRTFGNQQAAVGTLHFINDNNITGSPAYTGTWYTGTYAGDGTTAVKVRNMGQSGWGVGNHIASIASDATVNMHDGSTAPDVLILSLHVNDEWQASGASTSSAQYIQDGLAAIAACYPTTPYVILVREWGWSYDYVYSPGGNTFNLPRLNTHAEYLTAVSAAATRIDARTGITAIVVDTYTSPSTVNQYGGSTPGVNMPYQGWTDEKVTASTTYVPAGSTQSGTHPASAADNIHANASGQGAVWAPTIRAGLAQTPYFDAPATPPGGGSSSGIGTRTIPSIASNAVGSITEKD